MAVDWQQFSRELADWERARSQERLVELCAAFERSIRRACRRDELLDFVEVTAALDCVAEEVVRMRRDSEGRKPCERIAVELEPGVAARLRQVAAREGLDVSELMAALVSRSMLDTDRVRLPGKRRRKAREET